MLPGASYGQLGLALRSGVSGQGRGFGFKRKQSNKVERRELIS